MTNKIHISIPKPCSQNWQEMSRAEKGRFCESCQKKVVDFTSATDREIINEFNKGKKLCGRFHQNQLNRELLIPKEKSSFWLATASAIISFLGLTTQESFAQGKVRIEQTDKKIIKDSDTKTKNEKLKISGTIRDNSSPLPGANVRIIGTNTGVQTDLNGNFSIETKRNAKLEISFIGLKTKIIKVKNSQKLDIKLEDAHMVMGEVIIEPN